MLDPYVGCVRRCGWILGGSAISGSLFKCLTAIAAELLHAWTTVSCINMAHSAYIKSQGTVFLAHNVKPLLFKYCSTYTPPPPYIMCLNSAAKFNGRHQILMTSDGQQKWTKGKKISLCWKELIFLSSFSFFVLLLLLYLSSPPLPSAFLLPPLWS